jgi:hypothetical protein
MDFILELFKVCATFDICLFSLVYAFKQTDFVNNFLHKIEKEISIYTGKWQG